MAKIIRMVNKYIYFKRIQEQSINAFLEFFSTCCFIIFNGCLFYIFLKMFFYHNIGVGLCLAF